MRISRLPWAAPDELAAELRDHFTDFEEGAVDVSDIAAEVASKGDAALLELTARFDATEIEPTRLAVPLDEADDALEELDDEVEATLRMAVENVSIVAAAQLNDEERLVELPQGQTVLVGEVPVGAAGIYAPGGRASYPSTVVMGCATARVAGVERLVLVAPPGPDGKINPTTLAAASICGVDEIYAVGGAQAIFALARGTESIKPVDVIAGPGNDWVQAAKKTVFGEVGIDSLAGPSDLMVILDGDTDPHLAALDLCAQAEHGSESILLAVGPDDETLKRLEAEVERIALEQPSVKHCRLATVVAPSSELAIDLANAFAPEHLQLMDEGSAALASRIRTAGCVFTGPFTATAFGDYVAGSNHVLPTDGTGRIFGPLSPATFRRKTARVSLDADAARLLAGPLDALARAEGLPVHGMSATARAEEDE
ncbi:MAG TPA: histidinol dehydrogenase [Solirubrobacterales bacterium]|nr:histidinol dehydrogenase [Solirubrobacterales bacterium]